MWYTSLLFRKYKKGLWCTSGLVLWKASELSPTFPQRPDSLQHSNWYPVYFYDLLIRATNSFLSTTWTKGSCESRGIAVIFMCWTSSSNINGWRITRNVVLYCTRSGSDLSLWPGGFRRGAGWTERGETVVVKPNLVCVLLFVLIVEHFLNTALEKECGKDKVYRNTYAVCGFLRG